MNDQNKNKTAPISQSQTSIDVFSEFSLQDQKMLVELLNCIIEEQGLSPIKE